MSTASSTSLNAGTRVKRVAIRLLARLPQRLLRRLAAAPVNGDGELMAPEIALLTRVVSIMPGTDFSDFEPSRARRIVDQEALAVSDRFPPFAIEEDLKLPEGLEATRYRFGPTSKGLLLYFHGGGFVVGSRASNDSAAKFLARYAGVDVVSVEYRLAPEDPFPAAIDDAITAWDFVVDNASRWGLDPRRIAVGGDSAGGNLTAVLTHLLRGRDLQPFLQVLIYPVTDLSVTDRLSNMEFGDISTLTNKQMRWYRDHYLGTNGQVSDPRVSPLLAEDFSGLPPAVVTVGGFDTLRDDGLAYAQRLADAGVPTQVFRESGLVHAYIWMTGFSPAARAATHRIAAAIAAALS